MTEEWKWLESTHELQQLTFGFDLDNLSTEEQATMVKENVLAAIVELVEVLDEIKWKYWSHETSWVRSAEVLREVVDVVHFIGNILVTIGVDDAVFWSAYMAKQEVNRSRQQAKYVSRQAST